MKTRVLVVGFLLAVGVVLVAWFSGGEGRGPGRAVPGKEGAAEPLPVAAEEREVPKAATRLGGVERTERARVAAEEATAIAPEDARLVRVRVVLPVGVPTDDEIWLEGFADAQMGSLEEWDEGPGAVDSEAWSIVASASEPPERTSRQAIAGSGVVEVPFPKEAKTGAVRLDSRYVRAAPVYFHLEETLPAVEGTLGAWITGQVSCPNEDLAPVPDPTTLGVGFAERVDGGLLDRNFWPDFTVPVGPDLRFEARAVAAPNRYGVQVSVPGRVDFLLRSLEVEAGQHVTLEVPLAVGAAVRGVVVGDDGEPIAGATVTGGRWMNVLDESGEESAETDADGAFALSGIPPGKIRVGAHKELRVDSAPVKLELADGEAVDDVRIVLPLGGTIRGHVRWPDDRPVVGGSVSVDDQGVVVSTDEEGRFFLGGLGEGPFVITASAHSDAPTETSMTGETWVAVARGVAPNTEGLALVLSPPLVVRGIVVDDAGSPVPDFQVAASKAGRPAWDVRVQGAFSGEDGTFELSGLSEGSWTLRAQARGYVPAPTDEGSTVAVPQSGPPVRLTLTRALRVTGTVVDPTGEPVSGAEIRYDLGVRGVASFLYRSSVVSESGGRFEFDGIPPEGASLIASAEGWAESESTPVAGPPGTSVEDVTLRLRAGATIVGEVYDEHGQRDAHASVSVSRAARASPFDGERTTTTDASGMFRLEGVTPGKLRVFALPREDELIDHVAQSENEEEAISSVLGKIRSAAVEVGDGEEVHVTLGFPAKEPVHVTGRVRDAGEPVADAGVYALLEGGSLVGGVQATRTDAAGRFELTVNRPGDYVFQVQREDAPGAGTPFPVTVPDGPEHHVELELPGGLLAGVVLDPEGKPAGDVGLRVRRPGAGRQVFDFDSSRWLRTAADGSFRVDHLAPGACTLVFGDPQSVIPRNASGLAAAVVGPFELGPGEVRDDLVVRLARPGTIAGTVRDANGEPIEGASLFGRDAAGRLLSRVVMASSDGAGAFQLDGIPPGEAWVFAHKGELTGPEAGPLQVVAGEETRAELVLSEGSTLRVTLEVDGEPVRATVIVTNEAGCEVSGLITRDEIEDRFAGDGPAREYRVGPLPPGLYTVRGADADGHRAEKRIRLGERARERRVRLRVR